MKLLYLVAGFVLFQLAPSPQQSTLASIEGIVVRSGSGEPIAGARATLTRLSTPDAQGRNPQDIPLAGALPDERELLAIMAARAASAPASPIPFATTDGTGRFVFKDLEPGSYRLQLQANGYVPQAYGQRSTGGTAAPIALAARQALKDLSVQLVPAGNIGGRIRDRAGDPIPNASVQLLRFSYNATGQRSAQAVASATTDDRGEYRVFWVTPGQYYLMASLSATMDMSALVGLTGGANANVVTDPFASSYFPGVPTLASASPIQIQAGAEIAGMDLTLQRQSLHDIRVRLIDSRTGAPPASAVVVAVEQNVSGARSSVEEELRAMMSLRAYNPAKGFAELRDFRSGTYTVIATVRGAEQNRGGSQAAQAFGTTTVTVADADVDGGVITLIPSSAITGRVRIEGQLPANVSVDRLRVRLSANQMPQSLPNANPNPMTTIAADSTFKFDNVSALEYRVSMLQMPNGAYLKEARFDGTDALNAPMKVSGGGAMDLVISMNGGQVEGVVADDRGQPVASVQAVLVPDRLRDRLDLFKTATTGTNGRFTFSGLPPGDYKVFSWDGVEPFSWFDPNFLRQWESRGRAVHVSESSKQSVDVRLNAGGVQ